MDTGTAGMDTGTVMHMVMTALQNTRKWRKAMTKGAHSHTLRRTGSNRKVSVRFFFTEHALSVLLQVVVRYHRHRQHQGAER